MSNHETVWSGGALSAEERDGGVAPPRSECSRFNCIAIGRRKGLTDDGLLKRAGKAAECENLPCHCGQDGRLSRLVTTVG